MIQRDFILRLIEQLGALLRAFTSSQGRIAHPTEMFVALNEACRQGLGLSFETLSAMSPQEILNLFESGGATFQSRTALATCLFGHKAKIVSKMPEATRAIPAAQMALSFGNSFAVIRRYRRNMKSKSTSRNSSNFFAAARSRIVPRSEGRFVSAEWFRGIEKGRKHS